MRTITLDFVEQRIINRRQDQAHFLSLFIGCGQKRQRFAISGARTRDLKRHQFGKLRRGRGLHNGLRGHVKALQIFHRQINAAVARIFAHIADDIGELQSQAHFIGIIQCFGAAKAQNARDQPPHHTGHAVAVKLQFCKVCVARPG